MTNEILVVGGGIGGLTLALQLERVGIGATVVEAVPVLAPMGVGINLLPHASKELWKLGLQNSLAQISVETTQAVFYNRFGQFVHADPAGLAGGFSYPQYSIHRGELQLALAAAVRERLGDERMVLDSRATGFQEIDDQVEVTTVDSTGRETVHRGDAVIACDGVHSVVRKILHPDEGGLLYSGCTMWRGTTRTQPFLDGASMTRIGWLETGKLVAYPILNYDDGTQLINWVAEIDVPQRSGRDWNKVSDDYDFMESFADWTFDWLDVPALIKGADQVFEYPMMDQDPLPFWTRGRVTLLGDAAHPMVPRGSNGAGQAILDTRALTDALVEEPDVRAALQRYEQERLSATAEVVRLNRANPPDALLREVHERTGNLPFENVSDVISTDEMADLLDRYRAVTGSSREALAPDESPTNA